MASGLALLQQELGRLGLRLRDEWLLAALAHLRATQTGFDAMALQTQARKERQRRRSALTLPLWAVHHRSSSCSPSFLSVT